VSVPDGTPPRNVPTGSGACGAARIGWVVVGGGSPCARAVPGAIARSVHTNESA
jgi:hypothetical protein